MKRRGYVVAIDGPSGAGKSTVSRHLAASLGGRLLDTGAMYRAVAYHAVKENATTERELVSIARRLRFGVKRDGRTLLVNGKHLGDKLRTERISAMASQVSRFPRVRTVLTAQMRRLGREWSRICPVIVEGRDIGTVVFPRVPYKFFITASARERARRRVKQLKEMGHASHTLQAILANQRQRDTRDSSRKVAPMKRAPDARLISTSKKSIPEVLEVIRRHLPVD